MQWRILMLLAFSIAGRNVFGTEENLPNNAGSLRVELSQIHDFLGKNCTDCHNSKKKKGEVQLDNFSSLNNVELLELAGKIEKQVALNQMPPKELLPNREKEALLSWIEKVYAANGMKSEFKDEFRQYKYANFANHEQLFAGEFKDLPGYTEDRQWLISEYIFNEKMNTLLGGNRGKKIDGNSVKLFGQRPPDEIANPFILPPGSGVRYYANTVFDSGQFQAMQRNAGIVAEKMIGDFCVKNKEYLPAAHKITEQEVADDAVLAKRRDFMNTHIDRICSDIYKDAEKEMLPVYEEFKLPEKVNDESESFGKWGWRNRIGNADGPALLTALHKVKNATKDKKVVIDDCARYWFYWGEDKGTIERRINILAKEMTSIMGWSYFGGDEQYAYRPLDGQEMQKISAAIKANRTKGMSYNALIAKCLAQWSEEFRQAREKSNVLSDALIAELVNQIYLKLYERQPTDRELGSQSNLLRSLIARQGPNVAVRKLTESLMLSSEFVYRNEYGEGPEDQFGRRMLSPKNAAIAIAYALTDSPPDEQLKNAASQGKLNSKADYEREVLRLLQDKSRYYFYDPSFKSNASNTPIRKFRFFREFFGYPAMPTVFKDSKRLGTSFANEAFEAALPWALVLEADMVVDQILKKDKNVFEELLTTDKFYIYHNGNNVECLKEAELIKKPYEYFKDKWKSFKTFDDLTPHASVIAETLSSIKLDVKTPKEKQSSFNNFKFSMEELTSRFEGGKKYIPPMGINNRRVNGFMQLFRIPDASSQVVHYWDIDPKDWEYPPIQPAKVENRKGMLTHPAWLVAFAQNAETDPVRRGKWVREKLLAGTVPDVPITVEAIIPEDHNRTLRQRLVSATENEYCWKCHKSMNPLGLAFEIFDDFGRYRTEEQLEYPEHLINPDAQKKRGVSYEYKTLPVDAKTVLDGTGDPKLDGEVKDALDMIERLAKSTRVRQSIIRNAFRYFLGRNETLSDSKTLMDADKAYVESGGSFNAVIVSLLTSDSFVYRKKRHEAAPAAEAAQARN